MKETKQRLGDLVDEIKIQTRQTQDVNLRFFVNYLHENDNLMSGYHLYLMFQLKHMPEFGTEMKGRHFLVLFKSNIDSLCKKGVTGRTTRNKSMYVADGSNHGLFDVTKKYYSTCVA